MQFKQHAPSFHLALRSANLSQLLTVLDNLL